jgi:two-component system, cell cycle sensor histidine kinase PleC
MHCESNENFRRKSGRLLKRRIAIFSAAIMAAICVLVAVAVLKEREAALEQARTEAASLSASFVQQISGTLDGLTSAMELLKDRMEAEGAAFDLGGWKAKIPSLRSPGVQIVLVDPQGRVRASVPEQDPQRIYLPERYFFAVHAHDPKPDFVIAPASGKISMRLAIPPTPNSSAAAGKSPGVLKLSLDPEFLPALNRKALPGRTASIDAVASGGTVITRDGGAGRAVDFKAARLIPAGEAGEYSSWSPAGKARRFYHWRKVPGYPLFAVAGIGEAEALASSRKQSLFFIGLAAAALCLPLFMMLMVNREISRRVDHAVALDQESEKVHIERAALLAITDELAKERVKLRRSNKELALARRRAEEANQAKSIFLANMSHELRTPLNAVLGFSEIIRDRLFGNDLERYAGYAADIHHSGSHLLNIVNDILDVTRIDAGKFELREENVKLAELLDESLLAVEPQAAKGGISLKLRAPEACATIHGDKTKLKQIIINLLSNAIKFTPSSGSVDLSARADADGGLTVAVRDTGIGMASHEIRDAVQLFGQVDNSLSRRYDGAGLGLPLAIQLAELHGGTLTVESAPGQGTTVTVRFPCERVAWEAGQAQKQAAA